MVLRDYQSPMPLEDQAVTWVPRIPAGPGVGLDPIRFWPHMPDLILVAALVFHLLAVLLMPLQLFKIQMGVLAPYMGHLLQCKEEVQVLYV